METKQILLTGGTGRLGSELLRFFPGALAPDRHELDVTRYDSVDAAIQRYQPRVVVHAAAFTDVTGAEIDRATCWNVNVEGSRNVARVVSQRDLFMIHISTDYVFEGNNGLYCEDDIVGPVRNYYALTKLVAEQVVRLAEKHLVIRTSFRPRQWPYPVAFSDLYTSQDYVDIIAPDIALAIAHYAEVPYQTLHIATERKSAYQLALRRKPDVQAGSKEAAGVSLPADVSLNVQRWLDLKAKWQERDVCE